MNTHPKTTDSAAIWFKQIDESLNTVIQAAEQTANAVLPDNLSARVQKLVKVYGGIKPLLTVLGSLPIIPPSWRAALSILTQALDVVTSAPELVAATGDVDFKAGKDI